MPNEAKGGGGVGAVVGKALAREGEGEQVAVILAACTVCARLKWNLLRRRSGAMRERSFYQEPLTGLRLG